MSIAIVSAAIVSITTVSIAGHLAAHAAAALAASEGVVSGEGHAELRGGEHELDALLNVGLYAGVHGLVACAWRG